MSNNGRYKLRAVLLYFAALTRLRVRYSRKAATNAKEDECMFRTVLEYLFRLPDHNVLFDFYSGVYRNF